MNAEQPAQRPNEDGQVTPRPKGQSFQEAAIRDEISVLQRQLIEIEDLLGAGSAGLQGEAVAAACALRGEIAAAAPKAIKDVDGFDLRPDPLTARIPAAYMAALREFRAWAGDISLRIIAERTNLSASTLCSALKRDALPTYAVVQAVITGCGGSDDDLRRFTTAWRRLRLGQKDTDPRQPGGHAA